ncbi:MULTISPECIES: FG-GAP repeat domain-containing protein [unclassified Streptomyces]|uniref:FG-GAP repeat domain-containing protein n=1 Tax=unclassified Streptomyces TaxID=2593676 RepID=UPI00363BAE8F
MAKSSGLNMRRAAARATVAAVTAALVATGTGAAFATDAPTRSAKNISAAVKAPGVAQFKAKARTADAPLNPLFARDKSGSLWGYIPNGKGGLEARIPAGDNWQGARFMTQVDNDADGYSDGIWDIWGDELTYTPWGTSDNRLIGKGWKNYNLALAAGNLGGSGPEDLLARDASGVLWLYLGYGDGRVTSPYKVGRGWNGFEIAGKGDLTGDGKDDIVAKDSAGVLWLYKGTGDAKAPLGARTRIGSGWNSFNKLVVVGDVDPDGITDVLARDKNGALYVYRGTGNASAPLARGVKIGSSGWNGYNLLF